MFAFCCPIMHKTLSVLGVVASDVSSPLPNCSTCIRLVPSGMMTLPHLAVLSSTRSRTLSACSHSMLARL